MTWATPSGLAVEVKLQAKCNRDAVAAKLGMAWSALAAAVPDQDAAWGSSSVWVSAGTSVKDRDGREQMGLYDPDERIVATTSDMFSVAYNLVTGVAFERGMSSDRILKGDPHAEWPGVANAEVTYQRQALEYGVPCE